MSISVLVLALGGGAASRLASREAPQDDWPVRTISLTGVMAQGIWTDEEVTAWNSWRTDFREARPSLRAGELVRFRLQSADVVHSFALPALGIDPVEVYPGRITEITVHAERSGAFAYYCTPVCGEAHFAMRGILQVTDELEPTPPLPPLPPQAHAGYWQTPHPGNGAGPVALGAWRYRQAGCIACHGAGGRGGVVNPNSMNALVPELAGLARKTQLFTRRDVVLFREALLGPPRPAEPGARLRMQRQQYQTFRDLVRDGRRSVRLDPSGPRPPLDMPAWGSRITPVQVDQILAYLLDQAYREQATASPSKGAIP